jgi:hypothetical protein
MLSGDIRMAASDTVFSQHEVKLSVEGIDRMYLNVYVPWLQTERGVVQVFRGHRGLPMPSAALMNPMSRDFVAKLEGFVAQHEIPLVQFRKGQRKDEAMAEHLRDVKAAGHDRVGVIRGRPQDGAVYQGAQLDTPYAAN